MEINKERVTAATVNYSLCFGKRPRCAVEGLWTGVGTKTCSFHWFLGDESDASADLLHQLDSHGIPCSCRLNDNGTEH